MVFDVKKFGAAKFAPRTELVSVPDSNLISFFPEGEEPVFKVRGLTSSELATCNEAQTKNAKVAVMLDAITATSNNAEKVKELREAVGLAGDNVPAVTAKAMEMLVFGSVEPKLELAVVVKIAEVSPVEFNMLTNAITRLTGQGSEIMGKSKPSGSTQK